MKNKKHLLLFVLGMLLLPGLLKAQSTGKPVLFNTAWAFHKGDIGTGISGITSETQWRTVNLPHDWSIEGPFSNEWASATGYLPGGIGWYKKSFAGNNAWKGKQVYIYFDGVYKNSEVWINGHYLGKRPNGFISFQYELSPYLKLNGTNIIAVKADHSEFADSRWYTGSGIYRNVYLIVKDKVHIAPWDVAFSTPNVSAAKATVKVKVNITNSKVIDAAVLVKVNLLDERGKTTVSLQKQAIVKPGKHEVEFDQQISSPQLWDAEKPNLYKLEVSLNRNGKRTDEITQAVGIRSIRFDKDKGFFLNDKSTKLKGVCIHDDAGALGVAVPREVWVRRLKLLKDAGVNSLRLSHNPHADYLYDLCDKMGFLVMDEAFDEWEVGKNKWVAGWNVGTPSKNGYHEYFKEWADRDVADMVLRARNHPCVIMWSIGNEIDYPNDPYTHEVLNTGRNPQIYGKGYLPDHPPASGLTPIAKQLVKAVKAVDQTRPVTAALAGVVMSNEVGYPDVLDVVGYNYQEYRYPEDHKKYPNRIIYGSENGMQKQAWNAVDSNEYISAQYLWTGIDYLGEAGKWPQRSNGAGLIDLAGFKKPEYFFRQSLWSDKPMAYIGSRPITGTDDRGIWSHRTAEPVWNWQPGNKVKVDCFTNCQETELFLNGKSLGRQTRSTARGQVPSWQVDYEPGELVVKGYNNGIEVCTDSIKTTGDAYQLKAIADNTLFSRNTKGLSQIEVYITDKNGNPVFTATDEITVTINGAAQLLGLENGSNSSHESYQSNKRKALHGRLLAYVQTTGKPGVVQLQFSAGNLKSSTIPLTVK
ncbi:glycoside hydrolase family 2 TIM barrel-domain containing protein [Mucilaginibacter sp. SJ]|uniref:glycoside hydrolase family 2 TIM barrel-domain containing protein n=1 Tax=Mucilaginibacter sp. SJ TaxID=3029053 RepID=UPI0023A9F594|nr:glycoside hydrolase family 2 TIM barrel-domain containing protein [Mucilaginibacter sp. SJ]WEA03197.1 glycoside hydrolase family 2 TIM barrel-domain containing protein [Mucilaginibacter sp. SJ]